jgi:hypothetical protein
MHELIEAYGEGERILGSHVESLESVQLVEARGITRSAIPDLKVLRLEDCE